MEFMQQCRKPGYRRGRWVVWCLRADYFCSDVSMLLCSCCPSLIHSRRTGTLSPKIHYWLSIIVFGLTGLTFTTTLQIALNYNVDTFTRCAASAVAANTFLRSVFVGAFPLGIGPMYHNISVDRWRTIFGCVAALLVPVPFIFFCIGGI